jgi:hypothetical protein
MMGSRSASDEPPGVPADASFGMGLKGLGKPVGFLAGVGGRCCAGELGSAALALLRSG